MRIGRKQKRRLPVVLAGLAASAAAAGAVPALAQSAGGTRVGVVNVIVVTHKIQELKDFGDHVRSRQALLEANGKGHQAQLQDLQQRARNLKADSAAYKQAAKDFREKAAGYSMQDQLDKAELTDEITDEEKQLFQEVQAVTADLAKQKGLDLVIVQPEVQVPTNTQELTPDQLDQVIRQKTLLYVSPKIDLTDDVALALDAAYKAKH